MDETTRTVLRFSPDRRFTLLSALGVLVALAVAAFTGQAGGRLLAVVAAVLLAAAAASDLVFAPRLQACADGVAIRSPFIRARLRWSEIEQVRVVERMRLGLRNRALEIDAGEVLAEFTRRTLGADIDEALGLILALRPA